MKDQLKKLSSELLTHNRVLGNLEPPMKLDVTLTPYGEFFIAVRSDSVMMAHKRVSFEELEGASDNALSATAADAIAEAINRSVKRVQS